MLEIITGPMFSGKSEELMRRLRRAEIAGKRVVLFKASIDKRYSTAEVVTHDGNKMQAQTLVESLFDAHDIALNFDVIGIDEIQFFNSAITDEIELLVQEGKSVIVSGLDQTYRAEPFGFVPHLLAVAEKVDKLTAICHKCGNEATRTQRLIDGLPAPFAGPTVQVGGVESYQARCRTCFEKG
jgi:thymidine kinase